MLKNQDLLIFVNSLKIVNILHLLPRFYIFWDKKAQEPALHPNISGTPSFQLENKDIDLRWQVIFCLYKAW